MILPLWSVYAFAAAFSLTAVPLIQEKFKADGFALALWNKVIVAFVMFPFILSVGFPDDWKFYLYLSLTAVIFSISDVVYFRAVPVIGSGTMTRLLPSSVVISFFLWFAIDPGLIPQYLSPWWKAVSLLAVLSLFLYSAMQVKKCSVSWQGVLRIWPVIFAACTGGVLSKMALSHAPINQGVFAYIFLQSLMMVVMLYGYYRIRKPVSSAVMRSRNTLTTAIVMGVFSTLPIFLKTKALQLADNPGLVSMILITDFLWVIVVYRLIGRKERGNIWAGLGIVTSALFLILIKSL